MCDLDDYEYQQDLYGTKTASPDGDGGQLKSIFDAAFNGSPRSQMYRALIAPDVFPHEKPMLIHQWSAQDREMFCGGEYTYGYKKAAA